MRKKLLVLFLIIAVGAVSVYFYLYKGHRNIADENADFTLTVKGLQSEFLANDSLAYAKYQDKTVQVTGKVTNIDAKNKAVVIDDKLFASFTEVLPNDVLLDKPIKIKGRFLGYDDLAEEFKIDQTTVAE